MSMKPVQGQVKALFGQALRNSFPSIPCETVLAKANPKFGDYQCNNVMQLFKDHGAGLGYANMAAMAEQVKSELPPNDIIGDITISPQGFITVKLKPTWLTRQVAQLIDGEVAYEDQPRKRVVVDFSSPNIAKEMHVGHLRSTIIGESCCRLLEFCGHEVHRINHVGDWGTQFGMLIEYMKETYPNFQEEMPNVSDLQAFYKASKKRFDEDEAFKKRSQLNVVDLQAGGEFALGAWKKICEISRLSFQVIYDRLGITLEERGESYYNSMIPTVVKELQARGLVIESDGAQCLFTPRVAEIPLMAVKGDGGYGYDSTDLAAVYHRLFLMRSDWIIYVTDLGQETHFHMIFDAALQAGWHRPPATRLDHMGFGVVQGEDKKKFKTRSGDTVKLIDLLDEAKQRALDTVKERVAQQKEKGEEVILKTEKEQVDAAELLGIASVRYFDMKQNRQSSYVFDYDRMLSPNGNTAVYLNYAYVRICSIQRKAGGDISKIPSSRLELKEPAELDLARCLLRFSEIIEGILANLHIHALAEYLWELCNCFTTFYKDCRVHGSPEMESRLLLCEATRKVMHKSCELLGFRPLEKL